MIGALFVARGTARTAELAGAIMNLFLGAVCLMCGLSGALVFVGTTSGLPFSILGGALVLLGGVRAWRWNARRLRQTAIERGAGEAASGAPGEPRDTP